MVWAGIRILATAFFGALFIGLCLAVPYVLGALFPPPVMG